MLDLIPIRESQHPHAYRFDLRQPGDAAQSRHRQAPHQQRSLTVTAFRTLASNDGVAHWRNANTNEWHTNHCLWWRGSTRETGRGRGDNGRPSRQASHDSTPTQKLTPFDTRHPSNKTRGFIPGDISTTCKHQFNVPWAIICSYLALGATNTPDTLTRPRGTSVVERPGETAAIEARQRITVIRAKNHPPSSASAY